MSDDAKMSFLEHLEELRKRLIICVVSIFVGMVVCWFFREAILAFLLDPLYEAWSKVDGLPEPRPLNFSSMLEPFIAYLKMAAIGGVFLASPVVLYQLWRFVSPGLYPRERRLAVPFVLVSTVLFVGGSIMAYTVVFPIGFRFFLDFSAGREMTVLEAEVNLGGAPAPAGQGAEALKKEPPAPDPVVESDRIFDGGVDGSVGGAAAPDASGKGAEQRQVVAVDDRPPGDSADEAREESWYATLIGKLFAEGCATFGAAPVTGEDRVRLTLGWHAARCGDLPDLIKVKRDGEAIKVKWGDGEEDRPGYTAAIAEDRAVPPGSHSYDLLVPANPRAKQLAPVLMVKDYLSFAARILFAFGLIFELPILISFLSIAGIVNYKQLISFSRYFFVVAVVIGAMLTPPDVITQLLLALPLMVLYMASIVVAYLFGPKPDE